jgi:parallel beta-helix repeat protein
MTALGRRGRQRERADDLAAGPTMMPAKLSLEAATTALASLAATLALALAGLMALSGGRALAQQVSCGDTIAVDTTLHKDLVDCPNNGIVIGADDVTLNLNGHLIDGDGTPAAGCDPETESCDVGVLSDGHDGVTVMHGSIRRFDAGAVVGEARHNRLLDISSSRNFSFGIVVFDSARSLVRNSSGSRNPAPEGDGMGLFGSHDVRILHSSFRHNAQPGIHVADSTHNLIKGNLISRNPDTGMSFEHADRNQVRRNRFVRDGEAFTLGPGSHNVIARNHIDRGSEGIVVAKGHGNLVARNVVVRTRGAGISLGIKNPFIGGAHNVVRRNLVRASREDGFVVAKKDRHGLLKRNISVGARDDGFDIEGRGTKLSRNRAARSGDLGIEAVRGVIDGGGNIARHNGDPRQCTNVVCQ